MLMSRLIPVLLIRDRGLIKTIKFKDGKYIGDPINAVKIFNEKKEPLSFETLTRFMPLIFRNNTHKDGIMPGKYLAQNLIKPWPTKLLKKESISLSKKV